MKDNDKILVMATQISIGLVSDASWHGDDKKKLATRALDLAQELLRQHKERVEVSSDKPKPPPPPPPR